MTAPDPQQLGQAVECLLFVAGEPLSAKALARTLEVEEAPLLTALALLRERYSGSGLEIVEIAGGYQLATRREWAGVVGKLLAPNANKISRPALETVTIIAYRQPCTQAEIEAIRGVSVDGVLKTLIERDLVKEAGRKPTPGRPILYETTDLFLHYFGLASLNDLPVLDEDELHERQEQEKTMASTALQAAGAA